VGATTLTGPSGTLTTTSKWCSLNPTVAAQAGGVTLSGYGTTWAFVCPNTYASEVAVQYYGSGGGYSRIFKQPSYQATVVNSYLNTYGTSTLPPANYFNRAGRGYPDVSMYGDGFPVLINSALNFVGGTSLSSPLFAGVISLINEIAAAHGKSTVGFVNPLIYAMQAANPATFRDITSGNNKNCPASSCGSNTCAGYTCVTGWDPVTGLGTIHWATAATWLNNYFATL